MTPRASSRLGLAVGIAALLLLGVDLALVWLVGVAGSGGPPPATIWLLSMTGAPLVGLLITSRRPGHPYGWLLLSFGVTSALLELTELSALYLLQRSAEPPRLALVGALATQPLWAATVGHVPLLLLLFPDGRLPSPRWRWLVRAVVTLTLVGAVGSLFIPGDLSVVEIDNPLAVGEYWAPIVNAVVVGMVVGVFLLLIPAAGALFVRRRRGTSQERLQLRWFSAAAAGTVVAFLVTGFAGIDSELINTTIAALAFVALYGAIGVAVLRYRLYEIDRILSRTVSYAALTVVVVAVYLSVVTLLTQATSTVTGESPLAVAASTLAAAAVIGPARVRIQSVVDRRFNRARYDAARAVHAYRSRLRDEIELEALSDGLLAVVDETVQPRGSQLWLWRREQVAP